MLVHQKSKKFHTQRHRSHLRVRGSSAYAISVRTFCGGGPDWARNAVNSMRTKRDHTKQRAIDIMALRGKVWVDLGLDASESPVIAGFRACESCSKSGGIFGWRLERASGGSRTRTLSRAFDQQRQCAA